jgi:hypothetical protein
VSTASHRRSGAAHEKPASWHVAQLDDAQTRAAALLGLAWPPPGLPVAWGMPDLLRVACRPGMPRLSVKRRTALLQRLDALETLRVGALLPGFLAVGVDAPPLSPAAMALARETVRQTAWAVRRPGAKPAGMEHKSGG